MNTNGNIQTCYKLISNGIVLLIKDIQTQIQALQSEESDEDCNTVDEDEGKDVTTSGEYFMLRKSSDLCFMKKKSYIYFSHIICT